MCYLSIKDTLEQRAGVSCDKVDPTLQREEKIIWLEKTWFVDQKKPNSNNNNNNSTIFRVYFFLLGDFNLREYLHFYLVNLWLHLRNFSQNVSHSPGSIIFYLFFTLIALINCCTKPSSNEHSDFRNPTTAVISVIKKPAALSSHRNAVSHGCYCGNFIHCTD